MSAIGSDRGREFLRIAAAACALFCALAASRPCAAADERLVVIHAGTLLAIPGQAPLRKQTLVIRDGRITEIRSGFVPPAAVSAGRAAQFVDLSRRFVLPGLIDLHVHLTTEVAPGEAERVVTETAADLALRAQRHARQTLLAGFTTVLDLGTGRLAHEEAIYALRAAINDGIVVGPRILAVGSPISATGSSRTGRFNSRVASAVGPEAVCDGADACRAAVQEQIRRGADAINFYNSGSLNDRDLVERTMTDAEMQSIVDTAHALGRKVIADGHTAQGINAALRAGADIIDTAPWPDETTWALFKGRKAFFEPHLYAFAVAARWANTGTGNTDSAASEPPAMARIRDVMSRPSSAQVAYRHGVRLAYGSDTGIVEHGDNAGDLNELVAIGLTPMEAISVATVNSAAAIGRLAEIGTLEAGKHADLIATDTSPLDNIDGLRRVTFVMRDGVIYKGN